MPQGEVIKGEDGVILLKDTNGTVIGEAPCMTSWTLEASASVNTRSTKCMKSNGDGGSGSSAGWASSTVESKEFSLSIEFFYQQDRSIPAAVKIDPTNVGDRITFELYPNDNQAGRVVYTGDAILESAPISSEVNGDITVSASFKGDGELSNATVV